MPYGINKDVLSQLSLVKMTHPENYLVKMIHPEYFFIILIIDNINITNDHKREVTFGFVMLGWVTIG